jgi:hypothetical protein
MAVPSHVDLAGRSGPDIGSGDGRLLEPAGSRSRRPVDACRSCPTEAGADVLLPPREIARLIAEVVRGPHVVRAGADVYSASVMSGLPFSTT